MTTRSDSANPQLGNLMALREQLDGGRKLIERRFLAGATGAQVTGGMTELVDKLVVAVIEKALATLPQEERGLLGANSAVIAVGGTGRGDLAPYSDVDLLFLHTQQIADMYQRVIAGVVRDLWDIGLRLGHSVRTVKDSVRMARTEPQFATSLVEQRFVAGSKALAGALEWAFQRRLVSPDPEAFVDICVAARQMERVQFGGTVQQLEPDVKRSLGGLRDYHLIRWIGAARYGDGSLDVLKLRGAVSRETARSLQNAYEFLTIIRCNLHFHAGKSQDTLSRADQLRIAETQGISATAGQLPVERFMQDYFRHTAIVADVAEGFSISQQRHWAQSLTKSIFSTRIDHIYVLSQKEITVPQRFRKQHLSQPAGVMKLFWSAGAYRVEIAADLVRWLKVNPIPEGAELDDETIRLFLDLLNQVGSMAKTLRGMYAVGLLEFLLPCWRHIRCLLQFNQYHSFTVDEHTLRAIEAAEAFQADQGPLGQAYRATKYKTILHLALLLHDAGKGYEEEHCDVGRRLAGEVAERLKLSEEDREQLAFLVYSHLLMSQLAFRRDTTDPEVLLRLNHEVGSAENLRMLFVLTAADITAVGPGVWNEWKRDLLTGLFDRAMHMLTGTREAMGAGARLADIRAALLPRLAVQPLTSTRETEISAPVVNRVLQSLPDHYLLSTPIEQVALDLHRVLARKENEISIEGRFDAETKSVEYRVITHESVAMGCFHKITGVLTAKRMEILSAQIATTSEGIVIDSYRVLDRDHDDFVPDWRIEQVATTIRQVLSGEKDVERLLAQPRGILRRNANQSPLIGSPQLATRVVFDQDSSDRSTVLDVFAHDRPGLLYQIGRTLFENDVSVNLAKISTHFDQVVDVFYITNRDGQKIGDRAVLKQLREQLYRRLQETSEMPVVTEAHGAI